MISEHPPYSAFSRSGIHIYIVQLSETLRVVILPYQQLFISFFIEHDVRYAVKVSLTNLNDGRLQSKRKIIER